MNLTGASTVVRCQACREFIAVEAETCRFCHALVDREYVKTATRITEGLRQARNIKSAHSILSTVVIIAVFFDSLQGWFVALACVVGEIAILSPTVQWWRNFRDDRTDPDIAKAWRSLVRFTILVSLGFLTVMVALGIGRNVWSDR